MTKKRTPEEQEYLNLVNNTRDVIKTPQGRALIWHFLSMCPLYSDTFSGNSRTFYEEGKRAVGLEMLGFLEDVDPTFYPKMLLEEAKKFKEVDNNDG